MTSRGIPEPDLSRIQEIELSYVVQAYLACSKGGHSLPMLQFRLKTLADPADVGQATTLLRADSKIRQQDGQLVLSNAAKQEMRRKLGSDADAKFLRIRDQRFPVQALGFDPEDAKVRKQLSSPGMLATAIVAMAYGLAKESRLSSVAVRSEIVWQILRGALGERIGRGPFPPITVSNVVDRTILASVSGTMARSSKDAMSALAANVLGSNRKDPASLRLRLAKLAIRAGTRKATPSVASNFAARVKSIAQKLSTPPFRGRVAIAQVYDEFGRHHRDAGSLSSFKDRLVEAARARDLDLGRLDLPEHMSRDLRERSVTKWGSDEVHFVVTEWI